MGREEGPVAVAPGRGARPGGARRWRLEAGEVRRPRGGRRAAARRRRSTSSPGLQEPDPGTLALGRGRRPAPARVPTCPSATSSCHGAARSTTRTRCWSARGVRRREARRAGRRRCSSASGSRRSARVPGRAVGGDARARGLPAHSAGRAARPPPSTSRSPRSTPSPGRRRRKWLAGALARERRTVALVTDDVQEALLLSDRKPCVAPPRLWWWREIAAGPARPPARARDAGPPRVRPPSVSRRWRPSHA